MAVIGLVVWKFFQPPPASPTLGQELIGYYYSDYADFEIVVEPPFHWRQAQVLSGTYVGYPGDEMACGGIDCGLDQPWAKPFRELHIALLSDHKNEERGLLIIGIGKSLE